VLGHVTVQTGAAVVGEGVEVGTAVDDVASPEEGVGVRVGDGSGLVARDGGLNVLALRGEAAVLEEEAEDFEPVLDGAVVDGLES
jgi:hypothetical protein